MSNARAAERLPENVSAGGQHMAVLARRKPPLLCILQQRLTPADIGCKSWSSYRLRQTDTISEIDLMGLSQDYAEPSMEDTSVTVPYPAQTKQAAADINGVQTDVMSIFFSDKIMITITQNGRLAQWVSVPLVSDNPTHGDPYFATVQSGEDSLLPTARFQARTLLGAGNSEREMMGQLYASQIASLITTKNPEEQRTLLLGLGLAKADTDRDVFLEIVNLAVRVL